MSAAYVQRNSAGYAIRSNRNVVAAGCGDADERTSGLSRTPGKRVWANPQRGLEPRPPLQAFMTNGPLWPVLHFYLSAYLLGASTNLGRCASSFSSLESYTPTYPLPRLLVIYRTRGCGCSKGRAESFEAKYGTSPYGASASSY